MDFLAQGGVAHVIFYPLESEQRLKNLESSLIRQFKERSGKIPSWNRSLPQNIASGESYLESLAGDILDKLKVESQVW